MNYKLPCPFCGEIEALRIHREPIDNATSLYMVQCPDPCWAEGPCAASPNEAWRLWNYRPMCHWEVDSGGFDPQGHPISVIQRCPQLKEVPR